MRSWLAGHRAAFLAVVAAAADPRPGIVVEKPAKGADFEVGDVLVAWSRGAARGDLASPLDLYLLAAEQAPRGPVTVTGTRGGRKRSWTVGEAGLGLEARPALPPPILSLYQQALALRANRPGEAATRLLAAAPTTPPVQAWLARSAAGWLADAKQWPAADDAFARAIAAAGDHRLKIVLLQQWGRTFRQRNDWPDAEKRYRQALEASAGADDLYAAASVHGIGLVIWQRGDQIEAAKYFRRSLAARRRLAPGSLAVATSLSDLGGVLDDLDPQAAERLHRQALALRQKRAPGGRDVAVSLNNLAKFAKDRGDLDRAEDLYRQALAIETSVSPGSENEAANWSNLGTVAFSRGDLIKADAWFRRALEIATVAVPGGMMVAISHHNLGSVATERGDPAEGRKHYQQAVAIYDRVAPDSQNLALVLGDLASMSKDAGDLAGAEASARRALEIMRKRAAGSLYEAGALAGLADIARARGDRPQAGQLWQQAFAIYHRIAPEGLDTAATLVKQGDLARDQGEWTGAEQSYRQAAAIADEVAPASPVHSEALADLALVMRHRGQLEPAARLWSRALDAFESHAARLGGAEELRASFRAGYARYYKSYIDLLMAQDRPALAFEVAERWRARTLLETLAAARVDVRKGVPASLLDRARSLQSALAAKSSHRIQLIGEHHATAALDREIEALLAEHRELAGRIQASSPGYASLTQPRPLRVAELQQGLLDQDTVLVEYVLGEERSFAWVIGAGALSSHVLPRQSEIEAAARKLYQLLTEGNRMVPGEPPGGKAARQARAEKEYPAAAATLAAMVLGPLSPRLEGKRLVVVADGPLQYIPFALLPLSGAPLVVGHEITHLPSASVWAALRRQADGRQPAPRAVAVLADPVFTREDGRVQAGGAPRADDAAVRMASARLTRSADDVGLHGPSLPRLQFTRQEAKAILDLAPPGTALGALDFQASRATATSGSLAQYRVVHFATHGLLDSRHPELSGLVLSLVDERGNPQNGYLDLQDIYNLNLPAELVVLSGCQTGLGKEISGEGLVGLARGFMYAGASRVLATLWKVDDLSTAELMGRFYRAMQRDRLRPAAALREAQLGMQKEDPRASPFTWAAFQLQGLW